MDLRGTRLGIYDVGAELGRGGMGTVYRATATAPGPAGPPGAVVALKVIHADLVADDAAFARFRQEAEIGKEILHDHLVRTYGLGTAEADGQELHFVVLELVEGKTLKKLGGELGTLPEHLLFEVSDQVLGALEAMHGRGVVHRDLKPDNIVITPDHRVVLMDLGVAFRRDVTDRTAGFVGSASYASPEQFAEEDVGPRADLYAFGVTLFELATGRNPYEGADFTAVVQRKLREELPRARTLAPDLDPFWDEVIATCARREATARFASAGELRRILAEGEASAWWTGRRDGIGASAERALKRLRPERRTRLVGRGEELARLKEVHERARQGGGVLLLGGPSGAGKSRLLCEYLETVVGAGGPLLATGRGVGAGGRGYGPWIEILGDLLAPGEPGEKADAGRLADRLRGLLQDQAGAAGAVAAFALGRLQPGPETDLSKEALFAAAARIVRGLSGERPLLLVVDDLHLAGAESVELFGHLARCVPGHAVLLAGVYADDELAEGSALAQLLARAARDEGVATFRLGNLPAGDEEDLIRIVVGHERTVRALAPTLRGKSEGNPLLGLEILEHLRRGGALVGEEGGLELAGDPGDIALPETVRDLVGLKLAALEEEERETLDLAAVLGAEFAPSVLSEVLGEAVIELAQRLAGLERKHRLVAGTGKDRFRFANRRTFEAVYEAIPPSLRGEYHSVVADTLLAAAEEPAGEEAFTLLRHLLPAERALEAEPFLEAALDHLAAHFHASFAAPFLEQVAAAFADAPAAKRLAIAFKLWAFYDLLASRKDQVRVLEQARGFADEMDEPGPRARVHAYRAGSWWYAGDYGNAGSEAEAGLALAREAGDRKWESTCMHTLGVVAYFRGDPAGAAAQWREALRIRREIGDRRGVASTLQSLTAVLPSIGEADRLRATMEESLAAWREIGERRGEASMLMNLGNHFVDTAEYDKGLQYLAQAIEGHRETGALLNEATALTNLGRAQHIVGFIDDARVSLGKALRLFVDAGNPNGELTVHLFLGSALGAYGEVDDARGHLEDAIRLAERTGAKAKLVTALRELGDLLHQDGSREEGWTHLERALALEDEIRSASSRVLTLGMLGRAALREGDFERAAKHLAEAAPGARAGRVHGPLILCRLALAHAGAGRREEAEACAREAREIVDAGGAVSTVFGPEIFFALHAILEDEGAGELLALGAAMVRERAKRIRHDGWRQHFLHRSWPNAELLAKDASASGDGA